MALVEWFGVDVRVSDIDGHVDGVNGFVGICDAFVAALLLIGEVVVLGERAIRKAAHCYYDYCNTGKNSEAKSNE